MCTMSTKYKKGPVGGGMLTGRVGSHTCFWFWKGRGGSGRDMGFSVILSLYYWLGLDLLITYLGKELILVRHCYRLNSKVLHGLSVVNLCKVAKQRLWRESGECFAGHAFVCSQ